ncbi:spike protein [Halorubrum virus Humcor2]|nr:spike protein [Halorubrum virus Humcor2]
MGADGSDTNRPARLGRRTFVKGLGAAGVTTVGLSHDRGFAQDAEAIAPLVGYAIGAAAISAVGGIGVGWTLREFEVVGSDDPAEGLTPDVLRNQLSQSVKKRKSNNQSTIVDNQNILDGVEHTAYTEAKIAAIEELNAGSSESAVLSAANSAIDSYETTVRSNFYKSWNETVRELEAMTQTVIAHSEVGLSAITDFGDPRFDLAGSSPNTLKDTTLTMPDGTDFTLLTLNHDTGWSDSNAAYSVVEYNPKEVVTQTSANTYNTVDGTEYMKFSDWNAVETEMNTTFTNVRNGISTWVTNVYGDVQSGAIEISDLVTPRERAAMMAQEEGMSQAIADLIALNVPVDAEREATITIQDTGATLPGTFALTDSSDGPLSAGQTYDPSTFSGDVYFTADMSLVEGPWDAINSGIDGGSITITSEPYEGTTIEVTTVESETVSVPAADWTDNGDGTWSYDASADLKTTITNVDSARFHATATETTYDTLQLKGAFTVDKLVNKQSGEEVSSTSFDNSEPQTDSNYITQDEWDQLEQQNQELIEKYENSQSGGSIDLGQFDMFGIPGEIVAIAAAALVALGVLSN